MILVGAAGERERGGGGGGLHWVVDPLAHVRIFRKVDSEKEPIMTEGEEESRGSCRFSTPVSSCRAFVAIGAATVKMGHCHLPARELLAEVL
jgi:hypothetical protein